MKADAEESEAAKDLKTLGASWPVSGGFSGAERNEVKATRKRLEIVSGCEAE